MKPEYDVFISFKHRESDGVTPTRDSHLAEEIFHHLTSCGFRVFFSKISLELLGRDAYKRAIDDALDASTVLIAVGTSLENLESRWVYYEWDSFLQEILSGRKRNGRVFACVEAQSRFLLPYPLRSLTVFRHGSDPLESISNYIGAQKTAEQIAREAERRQREREAAALEAERLEREAAAREELRQKRDAAARKAERELEAAMRNAELKREAALREVERLEREIAANDARIAANEAEMGRLVVDEAKESQLQRLLNHTNVAEMTEEQATALEAALRGLQEHRRGNVAELARTTLEALVCRDESEVSRLVPKLIEALAQEAAGESMVEPGEPGSRSAPASRGLASVAHRHADPKSAANASIEYRKALARWKSLPFLERIRTKEPARPPGVMG